MNKATNKTHTLRFLNHGYCREHASLDEAITAGKRAGFEFAIEVDGDVVCAWSVFGGMRWYR